MKKRILAALTALSLAACTGCTQYNGSLPEDDEQTETAFTAESTEDTKEPASTEEPASPRGSEEAPGSHTDGGEKPDDPPNVPAAFTKAEIDAVHDFFDCILLPDEPFDLENTDANSLLKLASNWQRYIFTGFVADGSKLVDADFASWTENLYKPETLEKIIRKRLDPQFALPDGSLEGVRFYDSEEGAFSGIDTFVPEGYIRSSFTIVDEKQLDDEYAVTICVSDGWIDLDSMCTTYTLTLLANAPFQRYFFRRLPSGEIAPVRMELAEGDPQEVKARQTALKLSQLRDLALKSDDFKTIRDAYELGRFYVHDLGADGEYDFIVSDTNDNNDGSLALVFVGMDEERPVNCGTELFVADNGSAWYKIRSAYRIYSFESTINVTTGKTYERMSGESTEYTIDGSFVSEEEYLSSMAADGADTSTKPEYEFDITRFLADNQEEFTVYDFVEFCRENLIAR